MIFCWTNFSGLELDQVRSFSVGLSLPTLLSFGHMRKLITYCVKVYNKWKANTQAHGLKSYAKLLMIFHSYCLAQLKLDSGELKFKKKWLIDAIFKRCYWIVGTVITIELNQIIQFENPNMSGRKYFFERRHWLVLLRLHERLDMN